MKDVIGLGPLSINLFFQIKNPEIVDFQVEEFDKEGEKYGNHEHFQHYLDFVSHIGRKVWQHGGEEEANVILALANMGFDVGFVGKVGKDKFADFLIENLKGVDTSRIRKEGFTGVSFVLLPETGGKSSLVFPNSNDYLHYQEIDLTYLNNTQFLHMGSFVGSISFETQKRLAEEIASSVRISFRVGKQNAQRGLQAILPLIRRSYLTFINDQELALLGSKDYRSGAKELLNCGSATIACQVEKEGWYIASQEGEFLTSVKRKPESGEVDVATLFVAGILAGMLLSKPLKDCVAIASELAGRSNSDYGRKNLPGRDLLHMILAEREQFHD